VNEPTIAPVRALDLVVEPWTWTFAQERRADIDANFAMRKAKAGNGLWNGRILLMNRHRFDGDVLRGAYFETDFAGFLAWRDWGFPQVGVANCFAMGALRGSDGGFLLGVMGAHTANAGRAYFPAGTPDRDDIVAGRVDLAGSVVREVGEETGLTPADYVPAPEWQAVVDGPRIAMMRLLQAPQPAEVMADRIRAHLARETQPELAGVRIVRGLADLDDTMPRFVTAFLRRMWH
jgi:hypothetical protein